MRQLVLCGRLFALLMSIPACGGGEGALDAGPVLDATDSQGTCGLSWQVEVDGSHLSCEDVRAELVSLELRPESGAPGLIEVWNCQSGGGTSARRSAGEYAARVLLKNAAGQTMASHDVPGTVNIPAGDHVDLGTVTLRTTRTGGMTLSLEVIGAESNCGAEDASGAGITQMDLALLDGGGICVPVTFTLGDGSARVVDCPETPGSCIERTTQLVATGLTAGDYILVVKGREGSAPCYGVEAPFVVSGGDQVRDLGRVFLPMAADAVDCGLP